TIDGYGWPVWDIKSFGWDKVTKYRVEPGFYEVANAIIVNLDKRKTLSEPQKALLMKHAERLQVDFPKQAEERNEHYRKEQAAAGVQVITLTGKIAEEYVKKAYDAGWDEAQQLDPVTAPILKTLIDK
ncbi:MAG: ABC transporter substrate-binding protein, partial [Alphaproteobacteria bacterium]